MTDRLLEQHRRNVDRLQALQNKRDLTVTEASLLATALQYIELNIATGTATKTEPQVATPPYLRNILER